MRSILAPFIGIISMLLYSLNTIFWAIFVFTLSFFKLLIPIKQCSVFFTYLLNMCATNWISCNHGIQALTTPTRFVVEGLDELRKKDWYLVISNHQTWVDIITLQRIFNRRIPFLKFFLKKELIFVPVIGIAWWALDFPFMHRHSKSYLKKHPHMKGKDMETTRKACEKFRDVPVSIMNFVEGTRFTPKKHAQQNSPFQHLLKPKAGGVGFVLSAMGEQLHKILDVTISYPHGIPTFWQFVCGKVKEIHVKVEVYPITDELKGNYFEDNEYRRFFQAWLNQRWQEKDKALDASQPDSGN